LIATDDGAGSSGRIEEEISGLRDEIGDLVGELDRRRREALDIRLQLRRHPVAVSVAGLAVALVLGGTVAALVQNARRKRQARYKARQIARALGRLVQHPERVARGEPPAGEKILAAAGAAAATLLVRKALERAVLAPGGRPQPPARSS
jgi:hypothetical protein